MVLEVKSYWHEYLFIYFFQNLNDKNILFLPQTHSLFVATFVILLPNKTNTTFRSKIKSSHNIFQISTNQLSYKPQRRRPSWKRCLRRLRTFQAWEVIVFKHSCNCCTHFRSDRQGRPLTLPGFGTPDFWRSTSVHLQYKRYNWCG